ncbi:DUF1015 domain-containing protein [Edaphobacter dinghuensis]|uniref:DUF1015 domain-containing protein n=1 Tax=Edaphobacter dinghuensis TaxID=1560005 RepID=A0A917HJK7_9BACT|nr:DUF1015 domain-containing protein [Edaphobacter dinghuensis]GGG81161.1 hypothetical protein GCM10011585_25800 [Edaphobacter dinghuensis]
MARIYPFRALRYDTSRVKMEDVVTQPYDKITPAMQERYYETSPYNLIRVILGKQFPTDTDEENCYTRAAETLRDWRKENILREEAEPALYGYSQTYTVPHTDEVRERRGFIALGHLYDYADKVVYRHEQTFPKHKSDRLSLFKATRAYCEQIYMLYSDPAFTAEKLIFDSGSPADLAITDEYGVVHKVWKLTDPQLINLIVTAMADKKLIIADGHHRYETSVAYAKERSAQLQLPLNQPYPPMNEDSKLGTGHLPVPAFPEAAMMMTFVNMEAPGITILPTHRVVYDIPEFSSPDFITKASAFFDIEELDSPDVSILAKTPGVAIVAATGDGNYLLKAKKEVIAKELANIPARQAQLDVVQLHSIILDRILGLSSDTITKLGNVRFIREVDEAVGLVTSGEADVAFLIKPITLDQLKDVSLSMDVMPQKSTDFYPKLLSGLAIYALD